MLERVGILRNSRLAGFLLLCACIVVPAAFSREMASKKIVNEIETSKSKQLYIEGTSDLFSNFRARASQSEIHIESRMGGSIWSAKNPSKVIVYNNENKVYILQDAKAYLVDLDQDFLPVPIEELDSPTATLFEGRPAKRYRGYAKLGKRGKQLVAEFTCLDGFKLIPSAHQMWCRFLGLKDGNFGLPIQINEMRARVIGYNDKVVKLGQPVWCRILTTTKVKDMPLQADAFTIKPDWKQAKDKAGLLFSKDGSLQAKDIDEFFRSSTK